VSKAFILSSRRTLTMFVAILCLTFFLDLTAEAQKIEHESSNQSPVPTSGNTGAHANSWRLSLNYTGALYGYYRVEPDSAFQVEPPFEFLKQNPGSGFLLGMGDNFGPEFGASVQRDLEGCKPQLLRVRHGRDSWPPEGLYKDDARLPLMAECDNVARFLMLAGYRAIVPGKEDFMYSATWLRRIAILFHGVSHAPTANFLEDPDKKTQYDFISDGMRLRIPSHTPLMLASNLRLNFVAEGMRDESPTKKPKGDGTPCPLLFAWDPLSSSAEGCVSGGKRGNTVTTQMDWLQRLDSTLRVEQGCHPQSSDQELCFPVAKSMNLQAREDDSFGRQLVENQAQLVLTTLRLFPQDEVRSLKCAINLLESDQHKAMGNLEHESAAPCTNSDRSSNPDLESWIKNNCSAATADKDLCWVLRALQNSFKQLSNTTKPSDKNFLFPPKARQTAIRLLLRAIACEQWNVGYTISDRILVIGVVGRETMNAVPPGNLEICTKWTSDASQDAHTKDLDSCDKPSSRESAHRSTKGAVPFTDRRRLVGRVQVGDPALAVTTLLRGAWLGKDLPCSEFDKVVVMAQMPRTEAEELGARILSSLSTTREYGASSELPHVDLILSEAQTGHVSTNLELRYSGDSLIPVLTPTPAWYLQEDGLVDPVSIAAVSVATNDVASGRILTNFTPDQIAPNPPTNTMATALKAKLDELPKHSVDTKNVDILWDACQGLVSCQNSALTQYLLLQLQRNSGADVALLEDRDFYFGSLMNGYGRYEICDTWDNTDPPATEPEPKNFKAYCELRVALDRVLWKGDFTERVMVTGTTLKSMLATAQQESDDEETLQARDTTQQWLITFGITTQLPRNLSAASMGSAAFTIPGINLCEKDQDAKEPQYCVNGRFVSDDGSYLIVTSDHLAQENELYKALSALDPRYHIESERYITRDIIDEVYDSKAGSHVSVAADNAEGGVQKIEELQQKRPILQLDYAKVVAGFMLRKPDMSNADLATNFSGVADSRATTPNAQEVDFEAQSRMTRGLGDQRFWQRLKLGFQTDLEYDRAVTGNITGSPETVTYALNNFTSGGFLQMRLDGDRASGRWLLVIAPYQYQQQITGNYLNFKFATPPGQLTVSTPRWNGFVQRLGIRHEFGGTFTGSYIETGPEFSDIHNVLSSLMTPNGPCPVSDGSFTSCFSKNGLIIMSSTLLTPMTQGVRSGGWYWDVHIQRALGNSKHSSLTLETKGDDYTWPSATLPTQTQHAFTTTAAINFAVIGNLAFSPTYTTFFYRNQAAPMNPSHSLITNGFSVTAKWYFWRDAAVPFWRQMWFSGPASLDQTKSAKMK
jgi:hypothetical protein